MPRSRSVLVLSVLLCLSCQQNPVQPSPPDGNQPDGNRPPVVAQVLGTIQTMEGGIADFWAQDARDPDGDSLTYRWEFGDGSREAGSVRAQHLYIDDGVFIVKVVVSDPRGASDTATATVTINNWAPYISSFSFSAPPMPAAAPTRVVAHVLFSDPGPNDNPRATMDWGDGTVSEDTTHSYTTPGVYVVAVTVTDKDGAASTNTLWDLIWVYDASQGPGNPPGYDAIDLGTLGGNRAMPASLNNRGEVVGSSMTADSQHHAFLWKDGLMQDIGLQLDGSSAAQTINDAGWIGGALYSDRLMDNSLVVWQNGMAAPFRTGGEDNQASAVGIDVNGRVLVNIAGHEFGTSALYRKGELVRLGGFTTGGLSTALDINSHGQIVGYSAFKNIGPQRLAWHAFLYFDGVMTDLGDLYPCPDRGPNGDEVDCGYSAALSINDKGQIVGAAGAPGAVVRAVIWEPGSRTPKDVGFGTGTSRAVAINERGQIVGDTDEPGEGYFRDTDGTVTALGSLGGGGTQVRAMNEDGWVIGTSKTAIGEIHAFIWRRSTGMIDLGVGPYGARGVGAFPVAISDRGDVTGYVVPCFNAPYGLSCQSWGPSRAILWRAKSAAVVRR